MYGSVSTYFILICVIIINNTAVKGRVTFVDEDHNHFSLERAKRQNGCSMSEIACASGGCTLEENECDGKIDCDDGSDEGNCKNFGCTLNSFRCNYGACESKTARCNGKKDCEDNSDESPEICKNVTTKQSEICGNNEFQCGSGECIKAKLLCDGNADCSDNYDESEKACKDIPCITRIFFRCDYGACLSSSVRCNSIRDCFDGSDERNCPSITTTDKISTKKPTKTPTPTPTRKPTPTPSPIPGGCLIPPHPSNGEYKIGANVAKPGAYTPMFSILLVNCKNRYKPSPPISNRVVPVCMDGSWTIPPHKCTRACSRPPSTEATKFVCTHLGQTLDSCDNPVHETVAKVECASFHEQPEAAQNSVVVCKYGTWDFPFPYCHPTTLVCGLKRGKGVQNVIGGQFAIKGDYPWHVGIYNSADENICGASLINKKIVLSAAHCFSDVYGRLEPITDYKIASGKYYRFYNDKRDQGAQYSYISNIYVPERYKGIETHFEADVAVLILTDPLQYSVHVQPVCVDWKNGFETEQLYEDNVGVVIGWGQTVAGSAPAEELKEINVPYKPYPVCYDHVPVAFRRYLAHDKICAGHLEKKQAVCKGDSGGGLVFQRNKNRYYIRGIVSTSPLANETGIATCDPNQYSTYTKISEYVHWIQQIYILHRT